MLRLEHEWIWDSWMADDGLLYHLFFLKAPRALADPGLRHVAATVGHATSSDLVEWTYLGEAFGAGTADWDDLAVWTGSVIRDDDGLWRMFYTAVNSQGRGVKDQRLGVAVSEDLHTWRRVGEGPVIRPDPRWYKTLAEFPEASETWRDPTVVRDPGGDGWHLFVTARAVGAAPNDDGVIAHARSHDLVTWELGPPACEPGHGFGQLEVLQPRVVDGAPVVAFTCHPQEMTPQRIAADGDYSTWSAPGETLVGPWDMGRAEPFRAVPRLFAAPLVRDRAGRWVFVGFLNQEPEGIHSFEIIDPVPVRIGPNGTLVEA
ncbi:MAG TPA: glycosyl hydrolase [Dermatophilaceae bacterium]|nr:glycosyl hydrolase [Dermatophilaceae bacterium]